MLLIADDEPLIRLWLKRELGSIPTTLLSAKNGAEAVALCEDYDVDLAILDINMPVMNGIEAAKRIRAIAERKNHPICLLTITAYSKDVIPAGLFEAAYSKPLSAQVLRSAVQEHLS